MSEQTSAVVFETAAVSDRGLNEKRPLNEDSYLLDAARGIFVVADGVGGAEAGEVASQTAVEVLAEAFQHQRPDDDVEDLMELAIQRANASIYQLAHEERRFAMMATTVVALHLAGRRATIGHVGDSRLYRIAPDGQIFRETEDHSVVEEEVRAGRMTAEQAAHHPSRNVISRALGAEQSVEVDLKIKEVEDGTIFLLCSDGITRHLPDAELSKLLSEATSLEAACAEMKRRCYERGAEDNLTAVVVRVGARAAQTVAAAPNHDDAERTLLAERAPRAAMTDAPVAAVADAPAHLQRPFASAGNTRNRVVVHAPQPDEQPVPATQPTTRTAQERGAVGNAGRWLGTLFFVLGAAALAFYGGMRYQRSLASVDTAQPASVTVTATPTPDNSVARFEQLRREVDNAPTVAAQQYRMAVESQTPTARDPQTLYLYGRALLLSGKQQEAVQAFDQVIQTLNGQATAEGRGLRIETRIATAAAALKSKDPAATEKAARELDEVIEQQNGTATPNGLATPQPAPSQ